MEEQARTAPKLIRQPAAVDTEGGADALVDSIVDDAIAESNPVKIDRKPTVTAGTGRGKSSLHEDIKAGVMVPSIGIGARSVGFARHEWAAINRARLAGATTEQLREIVRRLVAARRVAA